MPFPYGIEDTGRRTRQCRFPTGRIRGGGHGSAVSLRGGGGHGSAVSLRGGYGEEDTAVPFPYGIEDTAVPFPYFWILVL